MVKRERANLVIQESLSFTVFVDKNLDKSRVDYLEAFIKEVNKLYTYILLAIRNETTEIYKIITSYHNVKAY